MSVIEPQKPFYMRLRRQISWLLLIKLVALIFIYNAFFSASHKAKITPQSLNQHMLNFADDKPERISP